MNDIIKALQFEKEQLEARIRILEDKLESDNRQISEYDHELRQAKRLLKLAVEDFPDLTDMWRYADEVLALIGGESDD